MAYCTVDDIKADFRNIVFSATSALTITEVEALIDEESAYIDARISGRFITPVVGTASLLVLKKICIFLVSCRVRSVLEIKTNITNKNQSRESNCTEKRNPEKMLNDIAKGNLILPDAELISSEDGICSFNVDNNVQPFFNTQKQQW